MELKKRTRRQFSKEIHECPQNVGLFSDQVLYEVLTDANGGQSTLSDKRAARAELLVRVFLSPSRYENDAGRNFVVMDEMKDWLGNDLFQSFIADAEMCGRCLEPRLRIEKVFKRLEASRKIEKADVEAIERAFRPWLQADGVIPVFNPEDAYLLPFEFVDKAGDSEVLDYSGKAISEWTQCLQVLRKDFGVEKSVRVAVHQNEFVSVKGKSLMLPILMAWHRKCVAEAERLPCYDPLRFLATGAIVGGHLESVATEEKAEKVRTDVKGGFLIHPGSDTDRGAVRCGESVETVLERIREYAELDYDTATSKAIARLGRLSGAVQQSFQGDWEDMIRRLDRLSKNLDPDLDSDEYLDALMLRSEARCHSGRTAEARELNDEARRYVAKMPEAESRLLRMEIDELVLLQDEEAFDKINELAGDLGARLERYCVKSDGSASQRRKDDLRMRYHGTMGQFEAYATLAGLTGHDAETAKRHFEKALGSAQSLYQNLRDGHAEADRVSALSDCTQDANYLLLWSALFDEQNMSEAYERAVRFANRLRTLAEAEADKNDSFRRRFVALGMYRAVLQGRAVPEIGKEEAVRGLEDGNGWVRATIGKYLGAVAAQRGDYAAARDYFETAADSLKNGREVLGVIHMTILAEAYRSLRGHDDASAEKMRERALEKFVKDDETLRQKESWRLWLERRGVDAEFPGLQYWY